MLLLLSANFLPSLQKYFRNAIKVSNGLDQDQDRRSVGPDLGPSCLQMLPADDISRH